MIDKSKLKLILPVPVLLVGFILFKGMLTLRTEAEVTPVEVKSELVETISLQVGDQPVRIVGFGTVEGEREARLSALVSGPIRRVGKGLVPGGRVRKGDLLLQVDRRDFMFAVEQQKASLKQAELELELERQRGENARSDWALLGEGRDASEAPLALREPQLEAAEQRVAAAQAQLDKANLQLRRATLRAPFSAIVIEESVQEGQLVNPGSPVASLVGTDRFRVRIPLPVEQLALIAWPDRRGRGGSTVLVTQELPSGAREVYEAELLRMGGRVDPASRRAELQVAIDDPMDGEGVPLLPGAFVRVEIEAKPATNAVSVPVTALNDADTVWTVDAESRLRRHEVEVVWRGAETTVIRGEFKGGEQLVVSPLVLRVEGAPVRLEGEDR